MAQEYFEIVFRIIAALAAGGLIGLERSHRGRPAGFRTHALVCLASSLLMLVTVYESHWFPRDSASRVILDPTRMAQGIMTGIGFVGAGAIIKEGFTVRGLTTAASIWITAAIGILTGIGFYFAALVGTVLVLGTLSTFRWIEARLPTETYAIFMVRFKRDAAMTEAALRALIESTGFSAHNLSYRLHSDLGQFEYRMVLRTLDASNARALSDKLRADSSVLEFRIAPTGD
ncbi:MAG TPA: MgtC/SapB family protein [Burkholderiales bacterium]|jgi:putative Mg2+ transporter-C (MgtC) family protein|nr:MgtC/SapB family protein [Burkholderiales bacterium]